MKILRAIAFAAVPALCTIPARAAPQAVTVFATWHMADLRDVTQAWYFTGAALSGQYRDGAPWASDRPLVQAADAAPLQAPLPPPPQLPPQLPPHLVSQLLPQPTSQLPDQPSLPAQPHVPPSIPEPGMASMLLFGLLVIFLRVNRKEELFG